MDELINQKLTEYRQGLENTKAQEQRYIGAIATLQDLLKESEDERPNDNGEGGVPDNGIPGQS